MVAEPISWILVHKSILYLGITFLFLTEISSVLKFIHTKRTNTSFIFIASFAIIILIGSLLLLLPNATTKSISFIDALFTSASAVCVTGLIVVDTGKDFTEIGQVIIMLLIQVGGLGIMTFTGLLGYLAAGSVSFRGQMALKSMISSTKISNVITFVMRIIMVTFFFEAIGALLLYFSVEENVFKGEAEHIFFSVFHSISAFCNAGFSTESLGLYTKNFRFNYTLQLTIAILIILGGMGFPILFNIFAFFRIRVMTLISKILNKPVTEKLTRVININSRIALATTAILLLSGMILYLFLEQKATLKEHTTMIGKLVTSFFGSVTPRTAGFNTVDVTRISVPMLLFYFLLMWIGASPSSTGGGIKTTTAAVAFLNLRSIVFGRKRTEVYRTQVSESSINSAFAVIALSLLVIGLSILSITFFDSDKGLIKIAFESVSAFSTVGLSLGITPELSDFSKVIIILTMFIGRVGALTLLFAFVNQKRESAYKYPEEEIMY
jgi:potassium uptake TrkH family protein